MAIIKIKNPALTLLDTANGKIAGENLDVSFENITDTGTEGTKVAKWYDSTTWLYNWSD